MELSQGSGGGSAARMPNAAMSQDFDKQE